MHAGQEKMQATKKKERKIEQNGSDNANGSRKYLKESTEMCKQT